MVELRENDDGYECYDNFFRCIVEDELENYINKVPYMSNSLLSLISDTTDLNKITDIIVNYLPIDISKKLEYLLEISPVKRVEMILQDMYKEEQLFNIEKSIDTKVKKELDKLISRI